MLSVVIPANNEEAYLGACLQSLLASEDVGPGLDVVVAANACADGTVALARAHAEAFGEKGWDLRVLDIPEPGKINALNRADEIAEFGARLYLDADIVLDPGLLSEISAVVATDKAVYTSGVLRVAEPRSWVTRRFAKVWRELPFVRSAGVTGAGVFAVSAKGRRRWGIFPDVIADDYYVRLCFSPEERIACASGYTWPMVEGLAALVRVRRRQNAGRDEILATFPQLARNEAELRMGPGGHLALFGRMPVSYLVYVGVYALAKLPSRAHGWSRGR